MTITSIENNSSVNEQPRCDVIWTKKVKICDPQTNHIEKKSLQAKFTKPFSYDSFRLPYPTKIPAASIYLAIVDSDRTSNYFEISVRFWLSPS